MVEALRCMVREDLVEPGLLGFLKGASIPRRTEFVAFVAFGGVTGAGSIGGEML